MTRISKFAVFYSKFTNLSALFRGGIEEGTGRAGCGTKRDRGGSLRDRGDN